LLIPVKKFLVDNAETMKDWWFQATYLLETLVWKTEGLDENGMDLLFTFDSVTLENQKDHKIFAKSMKQSGAKPKSGWHTDMSLKLGRILDDYYHTYKLRPGSDKVKKLTLIILTDGKWDGMTHNPEAVADVIVAFAKKMERHTSGLLGKRERRVSIEFVQFGNDLDATARLRRLDDDLSFEIP
jgi:hypothetical protein